jgi:5-(carboxyamino)imidazole ribonucleotide synthase
VSTIWVLGNGQLGAMMRHAGLPLAMDVRPVSFAPEAPVPDMAPDDLVTAEIEHWPETDATRRLADHPNFVNRPVFGRLADRLPQKQLLDDLAIDTAPWRAVDTTLDCHTLFRELGDRVLLKRRRGGYDGKGQSWLDPREGTIPDDWRGAAIAERGIPFDEELSLVGARDRQGRLYFYPLALNLHVGGPLHASLAGLDRLAPLQQQAETMLGRILGELDYVGVMAMECFRLGERLMVNELAPRVHNSGHWTQAGASISQFELHLRAVAGLPMATPAVKGPTVMINLLGTDRNDAWLSIPQAELYWYGKTVRPGRKVGHINFCSGGRASLESPLSALRDLLPDRYGRVIDWVRDNLKGEAA